MDEEFTTQLTGAAATSHLLKIVQIAPPLTLEPSVAQRYRPKLRMVERAAREASHGEWERQRFRLRRRISQLLGDKHINVDIPTLYDPLSGAVRLREWELHENENCAATAFFALEKLRDHEEDGPPVTQRAMFSDAAVLLRGPEYWPGWVTPAMSGTELLNSAQSMLNDAIGAVASLEATEPTLTRFKLLLGLADWVRNALLYLL